MVGYGKELARAMRLAGKEKKLKAKKLKRAEKVIVQNGIISVTKQWGKNGSGGEEVDEQILQIHQFQTEPATVRVNYGLTINLGNFQTARVDVSVQVPCYKEELADAYDWAVAFTQERVNREAEQIKGYRNGSQG